ncbi:D-alanyl-D-alanine carboxypeptidase family protein [Pseudobutyrivibrio ruminis]|uniref:D-alanyl-D-alanine carboxypeptidase family protein n=1 Tax=Pseudobutyrivibrio ruminis TaxID=46206 RepID=UPI000411A356|nr:serine hydrolase [Pseudobutyrivibrio ruminis]
MKSIFIRRILVNSMMVFSVTSALLLSSTTAKAAAYSVTPESGVLLSCVGTEVFSDADPATYVTTIKSNTPVNVIGRTTNGFWQVDVNGTPYYISQQALSTSPNTTAYKLTSFDAKAALVANASNGKLIYTQGALDKLEPASTTKIMTALLVIEAIESGQISLETPVMVSNTALASLPSDASHVKPRLAAGEVLNVDQLLTAMMVSSDCQACNVLAELVAGSVPNFVAMMNTKAAAIGCVDTNFTNPSGYPDEKMYTNAYSLYAITLNAIAHPLFNQYFNKGTAVLPATNLCATPRVLTNTDSLMDVTSSYYNPTVIGGKTGSANRAGQCLVSVAQAQGKTVISVVLGATNRTMFDGYRVSMRYAETNRLINLGFANY